MTYTYHIPRLLIGAPQGRSGKTTVTIGLLAALTARGYRVQPYKKGPDFIDPSWLTKVAGRTCRNLDSYLMDQESIRQTFISHAQDADIAVIEGAMGLFDGVDLAGSGSSAEIAKIVQAPVLLVVNCTRMTRSVAAMVSGFAHFDAAVKIGGVILNQVARSRHEKMLRAAINEYCGVPVLGALPKGSRFTIPDRHLGLIPAGENEALLEAIGQLGEAAARYLDLDGIMQMARRWPGLTVRQAIPPAPAVQWLERGSATPRPPVVIGVIRDRSFSFYYPENLEALVAAGAGLLSVSAIDDPLLPDVDGLYIGGGFPEVLAAELAANRSFRQDLRQKIEQGLPVYAECGGLMYLGRRIHWEDKSFEMVGALPLEVEMVKKPQGHGYMHLEVLPGTPYFAAGQIIRGHEFHNSRVVNLDPECRFACRVLRGHGINGEYDGLCYKNVLALYNHLHAVAEPDWARNFVKLARSRRTGGN
ncbi:cobyrinate a,c-diamide synthase [Desulforamulus hydrothermalis]|uniref:Cobyrinate a,c-diamide synthase n=1 Tax=Desulforamulus hydrothermalis Lam5 = DSM 18033 TaxID=1121428 RepID=K8EIG4_9FIRM|nr:cobyrinate a,c-diamide synthase [Desulforamulus hydrothermalis]CCO08386.1 Cobyrinic acid A,C-diamide synthase [Desulforamulus hydrothermalis Lam5 = DSM 18033]SHH14407.1 hydrogenobyrinic acid a,c-diamide synthase (glutamine-hydrolysing) [Desulforamulus hydrothermalis Lam5 = DSM 18033]